MGNDELKDFLKIGDLITTNQTSDSVFKVVGFENGEVQLELDHHGPIVTEALRVRALKGKE